ncbi:MAG: phosphate signaling complex protein PhoU [Bacteroidales bacterium]|jgi:phosphate transport system protein|nr:phosphate signaling complex protein PhoU [Bacteroidales bacterium]MDY0054569.1 phosphate signaling complex protein PhoU [Bacteroidales bacterium]
MSALHIDNELNKLKYSLNQMWDIVEKQLDKSFMSISNYDLSLARGVFTREKLVDAMELKIDSECENFIALNNPVAIDLRLALSYIKINNNLERIGDFAEGIAGFVSNSMSEKIPEELESSLRLREMIASVMDMFSLAKEALDMEDSQIAEKVFGIDYIVDEINSNSIKVLAKAIKSNPDKAEEYLRLLTVIRKIERIGDRVSNIAEEIVFYLDAKVLKHSTSQKK